jgi:hypothetical protein
LKTDERPRFDPEEYDELPPEIVSYRRKITDIFWNLDHYNTIGASNGRLGPDSFVGKCIECRGPVDVRFPYRYETEVITKCANGCRTAGRLYTRLELLAGR